VALARALVRRPALFLLDEPLSNLDAKLRTHVRRSLRELHRSVGVTMLYVTHDQTEAMTLGDRIALLEGGRLRQVGAPQELWERPADTFVAGFVGSPPMNLLEGGFADGVLALGGQRLALPAAARAALAGADARVVVGVRAESFTPGAVRPESALVAELEPETCESLGGERVVRGRVGDRHAMVRLFGSGELPARVAAPIEAFHFFSASDGRRLGP
jgi:ABC-type sugar transport system ATPase subunit